MSGLLAASMESSGGTRINWGLEPSHLELPSLLQTTDLSLITQDRFHSKLCHLFSGFSAMTWSFAFQSCIPVPQGSGPRLFYYYMFDQLLFFVFVLLSGSQAAGAAGCQHPGGEDGEQDADGGDWTWHGQHHLSELHGLPGGNSQGKYSERWRVDQKKKKKSNNRQLNFTFCRNGQRNFSTLHLICWYRTHPERPASRKRMSSKHANTCFHAWVTQSFPPWILRGKCKSGLLWKGCHIMFVLGFTEKATAGKKEINIGHFFQTHLRNCK